MTLGQDSEVKIKLKLILKLEILFSRLFSAADCISDSLFLTLSLPDVILSI